MRCLVVDPSTTMRRIFRNSLRSVGCDEIIEASDGKNALELCRGAIDAVITEWNMPGMSGVEMVKQLRANPETADARILMVTARNVKEDVIEATSAGVNGYLLKPFTPEALKLKIDELFPPDVGEQQQAA